MKRKLAYVLSGGGLAGSSQVGCLEVLTAAGVVPDLVVGVSVGALNGALFAMNPTIVGVEALKQVWIESGNSRLIIPPLLQTAVRAALGRKHLHSHRNLQRVLGRMLGSRSFDDLPVPLYAVATELETGEKAVFHQGPLIPALLASAAIPGLLPAVRMGGREYVDGGVVAHCSLDTAYEAGAEAAVLFHCPHLMPRKGFGPLKTVLKAARGTLNRMCQLERNSLQAHVDVYLLEPPVPEGAEKLGDRDRALALMEEGRRWTEEYLHMPQGERLLALAHQEVDSPDLAVEGDGT